MDVNNITISAILPNYNDATLITTALQSLLNQTEKFTEILIIDDGSTDNSITVIKNFMQQHNNIRLITHDKNQGICQSLNHGIAETSSDYVLLCAADDWYDQHVVAMAKQAISNAPKAGLICGDAIVYKQNSNANFRSKLSFPEKNTFITPARFRAILQQYSIGFNGGGLIIKRQAIIEAGMLYPQPCWYCDWLLYFVIAFRQGVYYIDEVFVHINQRKNSYSEGKWIWHKQKQALLSIFKVLQQHYPELCQDFKKGAQLPDYSIRYIFLFLSYATLRSFVTKSLLLRLLINNTFIIAIKKILPIHLTLRIKKLLLA